MKKAFSLIELSIVIIVIGILFVGALQGSKMLYKFKVQTARRLTQSSPVSGIKDLVMWLETTSTTSFNNADSINDNTAIQNWYDINPQRIEKYNATQNTVSKQPLYLEKGLNDLPALSFDGVSMGMDFSGSSSHLNLPTTIFVVKQPTNASPIKYILCRRSGNNNGAVIFDNTRIAVGDSNFPSGGSIDSTAVSLVKTVPHIMIATADYSSARIRYNAWTGVASPLNGFVNDSTMPASIGYRKDTNNNFFQGVIGEIIVFNRVLNESEINDIQLYLKQKWQISY